MNQAQETTNTRSRVSLVILAFIFIAPILFALIVFKYRDLVPSETKNFGELVVPARPLPEFSLIRNNGDVFTLENMRRKWSYIYFVENHCDDDCKLNLLKMRNARLGQGAEAQRVHYYLVFTAKPASPDEEAELAKEHTKLTVLYADRDKFQSLLNVFKTDDIGRVDQAKRVHMIDPIGNYMMFYNNGFESIGIMEDLKFLLKSSQIG